MLPGPPPPKDALPEQSKTFRYRYNVPSSGMGWELPARRTGTTRGKAIPSHNLYTEAAEELGYVGLALLLALIWSFLRACWAAQLALKEAPIQDERLMFLHTVATSLVAVVAVTCSLASPRLDYRSRTGTSSAGSQ